MMREGGSVSGLVLGVGGDDEFVFFQFHMGMIVETTSGHFLRLEPLRHAAFPPRRLLVFLLNRLALPAHRPPSPAAGRAHHDSLPRPHGRRVLAPEVDPPVLPPVVVPALPRPPHPVVDAAGGVLAAVEAVRVVHAPLAEDADLDRDAEFDVADHAVAAAVLAVAPAAAPEAELPQDDRVASLEDFGVRDPRVGHVRVHA